METIDVKGLEEEETKLIQKLVDFLREKRSVPKKEEKETIEFAAFPLGVKGKLTREEMYDYL